MRHCRESDKEENNVKIIKYMCKIWPEIPNLGYEGRKDFSDTAK